MPQPPNVAKALLTEVWPGSDNTFQEQRKDGQPVKKVQVQFNAWAEETGLAYVQLSRICAMSIGENYEPEKLASIMGDD